MTFVTTPSERKIELVPMLTVLFQQISNLNLNMDVFDPTGFSTFLLRWSRDVGVTTLEVTENVSGVVVTPTSVVSLQKNSVRLQIFGAAVTKPIPGQNS